jgi:uncharacterized membrane protein
MITFSRNRYALVIALLSVFGGILRGYNVNYASLWADELYSALLIRPGNSWYEILYLQRAYQPPGYSMVLRIWTILFGYDEFVIRLFSVVGGTLAILLSAYLGKVIHNRQTGAIMALLVAFSPTQIFYSLEARFYIWIYVLSAFSLLLYWQITYRQRKGVPTYLLKSIIDSALCYFHHFGVIFIMGQFMYDLYMFYSDRNKQLLFGKVGGYLLCALLYLPWVLWGLVEGLAVKNYWLKETDVYRFLTFNFGYLQWVSFFCLLLVLYFIVSEIMSKNREYYLVPFLCLMVTLVPFLYSITRFPILVDRYSMILGPAFFLMLSLSLQKLLKFLPQRISRYALTFVLFLLSIQGFWMSFVDLGQLKKQPWRQMAVWLNNQPDYAKTPIYSQGSMIKGYFNIDFYLREGTKAKHLNTFIPGKEPKFYLVETNSVWQITDSVFKSIDSFYTRSRIPFQPNTEVFGNIYSCVIK